MAKEYSKKRSKNFSKNEEKLLLRLALDNKKVIECKATDSPALRLKMEAWNNIEKKFNQQCLLVYRRAVDLREKYNNLKRMLRKNEAIAKASRFQTSGGPPLKQIEPPTDELKELYETISSSVYGSTYDAITIQSSNTDCSNIIKLPKVEKMDDFGDDYFDAEMEKLKEFHQSSKKSNDEKLSPAAQHKNKILRTPHHPSLKRCHTKNKSQLQPKNITSGLIAQRNEIVERDAENAAQRHRLRCAAIKKEHNMKKENLKQERRLAAVESRQRMRHQHAQHTIKMKILKLQLSIVAKDSNYDSQ